MKCNQQSTADVWGFVACVRRRVVTKGEYMRPQILRRKLIELL